MPFFPELFLGSHFTERCNCAEKCACKRPTVVLEEPVVDIVCYGIGKIASCPVARYQFALLLLLKELLQVTHDYYMLNEF